MFYSFSYITDSACETSKVLFLFLLFVDILFNKMPECENLKCIILILIFIFWCQRFVIAEEKAIVLRLVTVEWHKNNKKIPFYMVGSIISCCEKLIWKMY